MLTPEARGLALARRLERMSPAAQRLLTENSRWWPTEDGGLSLTITAPPEDADAVRELHAVLCTELDLDMEGAGPDDPPDLIGDDDGLTFEQFQELVRRRRATVADR